MDTGNIETSITLKDGGSVTARRTEGGVFVTIENAAGETIILEGEAATLVADTIPQVIAAVQK